MAGISTYNKKRDFARTPEPPGKRARPSKGLPKFVIQKHDATRLHFDFRLEIDGVLVSWAIPKGPSLDPGEKRLAVRTEDHPMAYGGFEGTIPEGEYGGGTVMLWDRGTWKPESDPRAGLRQGSLKFELRGKRLHGSFALVRLRARGEEKRDNWLLIKHKDAAARPGSGDAVVRETMKSVASQRSMEDIAESKRVWHSNKPAARKSKTKSKPTASTKRSAKAAATAAVPRVTPAARRKPPKLDPAALAGSRKARLPNKLTAQLATLIDAPPTGKGWLSEIKFDGYRMLARLDEGEVRISSRNGLPWHKKLPTIAKSLATLPVGQAWLDGEIVVLDEEGHSNFSALKDALGGEKRRDIFYFLFDILYLDGYDLTRCRQDDRKALLESLLGASPPTFIRYSEHMTEVPERIQERACEMHLEGIIVKQADAPYRGGRNRNWLKLKCIQREEFVVIGFTDPQGSRAGFGALHLGYYDEGGELHYAGGVGTGFDGKTLVALHKRLKALERRVPLSVLIHSEPPPRKMHWVKPELVVETQFIDWTGGGSVRHAVFLGTRDDKSGTEVVREPPTPAVSRYSGTSTVIAAARARQPAAAKARDGKTKADQSTQKKKRAVPGIIDKRKDESDGAVHLTHPDKPLWPKDGFTKADLAAYWQRAAPFALPYIAGRPLALVRCPDGIEGEQFFQKKASPGFPRQILDLKVGGEQVLAIEDADGLQALSQMAAIELHPWGARLDRIEKPDFIVMDLDPHEGLDFDDVVAAAHDVHDALKSVGLTSFCKTTGGKGLHVVVPFKPELGWDEVKEFAKSIAGAFTKAEPERFTDKMAKKARGGRIFIDYLRNGRGATAIAPFSPRARPGATIAMPLTWARVKKGLDPRAFTIKANAAVLKQGAAAWHDFFEIDQTLSAKIRRAFRSV